MNTNMIKKKRLNARSFHEFIMNKAKKHKGLSGSPSVQGIITSVGRCDKLEASCVKKENSESDNLNLHQPWEDSDSRPQIDDGEATVEPYACSVPDVPSEHDDKMLSSAESGSDEKCKDEMEGESKFKGSPEVLRRSTPEFIEYWVPAGMSYLQLEKYCEILLEHRMFLSAKNKTELLDLHDVLIRVRECCDHPYLMDSSLEGFVNRGRPMEDIVTTGIEASGKLLLLDKVLQEVKRNGQRAVIVFQSNHPKSKTVELRHLLDDTIRQRFGEESYVHIYRELERAKKRAFCDLFNKKENERFLMLMEKSSCQSNVELSSVDFVILFNSDWCPSNDMRCLRKMSIQSRTGPLKVLRFYSSNSVEEKVLALVKEGSSLESNINNFSKSVTQKLLLCGATYLFDKLDDFHVQCASIANLNSLIEEKLLLDVFSELSLLACQDGRECSFSIISKVTKGNGEYPASISLQRERDASQIDDDIPPWAVWSSLLEGRSPQWRLLPKSSDKIRRRGEYAARSTHYAECGNENELTTNKETSPSRVELVCMKSMCKKAPRSARVRKAGNLAGDPTSSSVGNKLSPCKDGCDDTPAFEKVFERRMRELLLKQKKESIEFFRTKKEERDNLEEEHQLQLDLINQGCNDARAKQEELRRLDCLYEKKVDKHKLQMDMKKKELDDSHLASRIEENKVKNNLISLSKKRKIEGPISSSLVNESSLNFDHGPHSTENATDAPITASDPAVVSKNKQDIRDESVQHHDPEILPDCLDGDTEILSVESDGESDAVSKLREKLPNTPPLSENLTEKTSQDMQPGPNSLPGGHLESDGENDVMMLPAEESLDDGSNLCTSNESQLCALLGQKHSEQASQLIHGDCTVEASGRASNEEGLNNPATVVEPQGIPEQTLAEPPLPRVASIGRNLQESQMCTNVNDSLPVEQAGGSVCLLNNETRWNTEASAVSNSQTADVRGSCLVDQNQFPLMNSGCRPPSLHFPMQSLGSHDQTHSSSAAFRSNMIVPRSMDPLENELKRIQIEEEEAGRICKEKMMYFKSACEKEIEEIRKKYALLQQQADVEHVQKKMSLGAVRTIVQTNKLLADTLKFSQEKPESLISPEALMEAICGLPLLQENYRPTQAAGTTMAPTPNQVQVVHQLSDLMSVEPVRLQNFSPYPSYPTSNPMMVYQARAPPPHLHPYGLSTPRTPTPTPRPMSGITSLTCRPNQMTLAHHGLVAGNNFTPPYFTCPVMTRPDGSPRNPITL